MMHPNSEVKAGIVERVNRTLQNMIYRYMTHNETFKWIDALDLVIESYNNRQHRSIDHLTPEKAELETNKNRVVTALRQHYSGAIQKSGKKLKFSIGDRVRLKTDYGRTFARGYQEQFSQEVYRVESINERMGVPMYRIRSTDTDELIEGHCYANELQLVTGEEVRFTVLARRRGRGGPEILVRWRGFSDRHNQWIPESDVTEDFRPATGQGAAAATAAGTAGPSGGAGPTRGRGRGRGRGGYKGEFIALGAISFL